MRASPELRPHLLAAKMKKWLDILRCPLVDLRVPTWRARRNFRALVRRYPEIATALGYTEALGFPSPLHGLWSPVQQEERQQAPRQEFPTDVTDPSPSQLKVGWAVSPALRVAPGTGSLEDEIL